MSTTFFMVLGVCVLIGGWRLGFGRWEEPGTGFMPVLSGALIFFLSASWFVITLMKKWGNEPTKKFCSEPGGIKKVIVTTLAFMVYTFLLDKMGFMVSTFVFMIFLLRAIEPLGWRLVIIVTLLTTIMSVLVFQLWLQVPFPEGLFSIYTVKKWIY